MCVKTLRSLPCRTYILIRTGGSFIVLFLGSAYQEDILHSCFGDASCKNRKCVISLLNAIHFVVFGGFFWHRDPVNLHSVNCILSLADEEAFVLSPFSCGFLVFLFMSSFFFVFGRHGNCGAQWKDLLNIRSIGRGDCRCERRQLSLLPPRRLA